MAGHGRSDDQAASSTLAEVQTDRTRTVEGAGQIGLHNLLPILDAAVENAAARSPARVGNQDVNLAEIRNNIFHKLFHVRIIAHVALIRLTLDAVLLTQLLAVALAALFARAVGYGHVGTEFGTAASSFSTDAGGPRGARHDNDLALEAKELLERVSFRDWDRHGEPKCEKSIGK